MKEQIKKELLKVVERVIRVEVEKNQNSLPMCTAIFHQPKRPKA